MRNKGAAKAPANAAIEDIGVTDDFKALIGKVATGASL
jgi:hypothetical protein